MAKRKPSERRNFKEEDMELNLVPMMNLISILIPALLISVVFVEVSVINVAAPAIGSAPEQEQQEKPDKPPLNLTVTITEKGYTLAGSGGVLPGGDGDPQEGPTIPVEEKKVSCDRYLDTVPPPRPANKSLPQCDDAQAMRQFTVYNTDKLTERLIVIKDAFPDERRIIIAAEPDIEYEAITDVMDASREVKDTAGEIRTLFDEVVLSPGLG